jgi:hypothetical protein
LSSHRIIIKGIFSDVSEQIAIFLYAVSLTSDDEVAAAAWDLLLRQSCNLIDLQAPLILLMLSKE